MNAILDFFRRVARAFGRLFGVDPQPETVPNHGLLQIRPEQPEQVGDRRNMDSGGAGTENSISRRGAGTLDDKVVFKTAAVGGFEKKAVLDYIYQMNEEAEFAQLHLKERIEELEESQHSLEESLGLANNRVRTLERDYNNIAAELEAARNAGPPAPAVNPASEELIVRLNEEIERQKALLTEKDQELQQHVAQYHDLVERTRDLESRREEVEKASYQLGKVMLDARADAETISANAKEQAKDLLARTQEEADAQRAAAHQEAEETVAAAKAEAEKLVADAQAEAGRLTSEAEESKNQILADTQAQVDATTEQSRTQLETAMESVKGRVTTLASTTQKANDEAIVQLRDLRRETLAVRQAVQEAFQMLQERSDHIDATISSAQTVLENGEKIAVDDSLFAIPELSLDEIRARKEAELEAARQEAISQQKEENTVNTDVYAEQEAETEPEMSAPAAELAADPEPVVVEEDIVPEEEDNSFAELVAQVVAQADSRSASDGKSAPDGKEVPEKEASPLNETAEQELELPAPMVEPLPELELAPTQLELEPEPVEEELPAAVSAPAQEQNYWQAPENAIAEERAISANVNNPVPEESGVTVEEGEGDEDEEEIVINIKAKSSPAASETEETPTAYGVDE